MSQAFVKNVKQTFNNKNKKKIVFSKTFRNSNYLHINVHLLLVNYKTLSARTVRSKEQN